MNRKAIKITIITVAFLLVSLPLTAKEPKNLHTAKQQAIFYHDSGQYDVDREVVAQQAISFLQNRITENNQLPEPRKLAIVFDIDETSLSNYRTLLSLDFAFVGSLLLPELEKAKDPAIAPTLNLYKFANENGVTVFFVTGRREKLRAATEKNLKAEGYTGWSKLFMKPDNYDQESVIPYKSSSRKSISDEGFEIVVNIGDQWSDLAGGYSERVFKLPNPYYYIP